MIRITPQQFKAAFLTATAASRPELAAHWNSRREYSALIFDQVLPAIAAELGISIYNGNYYYLDSVYYTERDVEHFSPNSYYARHISIAVEHENDVRGTAVEMNKLQLFNAPLKVLITYAGTAEERVWHLERYARIVAAADVFGDFATHRRQLVIFGRNEEGRLDWEFFAYESEGFAAA